MNIIVRRSGALGDVLSTTPVTHRLRKTYPEAHIMVATAYPNVFEGNLDVNSINNKEIDHADMFIDLDMAHETRRDIHAVDAYMERAFGDHGEGWDKSIRFHYQKPPKDEHRIAIHANKSWDNRTMPNDWWDEVVTKLALEGYDIIALGTGIDYCPQAAHIDARDTMNLQEQAGAIHRSRLFICGASGLFILAGATDTSVIVPMTINEPDTCLPWRDGRLGGYFFPLNADVPCFGCSAEQGPVTSMGCWSIKKDITKPDYECINTIKASHTIDLALEVLQWKK